MRFIADFHIHSKYSRATSRDMDLENLDKWAKIKGIKVLGTGDFTHPEWFKNLKEKLEPAEPGLFKLKNGDSETRFILTCEISCIYSKTNKVRKIHIIVFAPSFEIVDNINARFGLIGNLKSDGRPILGLDAKELAKIVLGTSEDCLVVPAHCLLPDTYLHSRLGIKKIKDIIIGDFVYTHKGRWKKVEKIYTRQYDGKLYNIRPYYFRMGLETTSEHPFYAIRSYTNCTNMGHSICKKECAYIKRRNCSHKYFESYGPQWIKAEDIKNGDILIFPRFADIIKDENQVRLSDFLDKEGYKLNNDEISSRGTRIKKLPNTIVINKEFCRLAGYYVSEGYTDNRDSISFCFNRNEVKYIADIKNLVRRVFGLSSPRIYNRKNTHSIEVIYFSKILAKVFSQLFYNDSIKKRASTKCLPFWTLNLPPEKQAEIFKGWWRGDAGVTASRELMNQMKIIALRLGIIPSITKISKEKFNATDHKFGDRIIKAQYDHFQFSGLAFFEDKFGLLKESIFQHPRFIPKLNRRHGWIDKKYIYLPVRDIEIKNYKGKVYNLETKDDNSYVSEFATVHNCWTPWFSIFGSKSGFNSIEECFEDYSKYIYAGETGLSSDPAMNWRLSALDKIALISNSDAHSPSKIGREANVFELPFLSYDSIAAAIKTKDPQNFLYTIEFFPEEGKYHYDGHRSCEIVLSPEESRRYNSICPTCGKPLTIGVMNRVEQLADKPDGFKPENAIPFKSLVPLEEIIAEAVGVGVASKQVKTEYNKLIKNFGNEFKILLDATKQELESAALPEIAEGIIRVREGKVSIEPGYDGVYGKVRIFSQGEQKKISKQKTLF